MRTTGHTSVHILIKNSKLHFIQSDYTLEGGVNFKRGCRMNETSEKRYKGNNNCTTAGREIKCVDIAVFGLELPQVKIVNVPNTYRTVKDVLINK